MSRSIVAGAQHVAAAAVAAPSADLDSTIANSVAQAEADDAVPQEWQRQVKSMGELEALMDTVLSQRQWFAHQASADLHCHWLAVCSSSKSSVGSGCCSGGCTATRRRRSRVLICQ